LSRCTAIKASGERCKGRATWGSEWCWNHNPDHAEERRRHGAKGGKRGGRGRPQRETEAIKTLLEDLTDRVLSGELETGPAAVANQLINTRLRAIEQERRLIELEDVLARLDALEEKQRQTQGNVMKGARRW
jgi:hypothetical protein